MAAQIVKKTCREAPSLLAADSEEELSSEGCSDVEDHRPSLLPLNEVIRGVPSSLSSLLELVVPRLQQRSGVRGVSQDDHHNFVSILVGELSTQFSDMQDQIDDPFLSPKKNKSLHRLVVVQACRILEDLYAQYTAKSARLREDGTLSTAAHMSRLRAQLAVQASKSINLTAIRHQVLGQLRGPLPTSRPSRLPPVPRWRPPHRARRRTNLDSLDLGAALSSKLSFLGLGDLGGAGSPVLKRRVQKLRAGMTQHGTRDGFPAPVTPASDSEGYVSDAEEYTVSGESSPKPPHQLQRPPSMPELFGNFLLCDWKLLHRTPYHIASPEDHRRRNRHRALQTARRSSIDSNIKHGLKWTSEDIKIEKELGEYTQEDLSSDLHKLSEHTPPLLHTSVHDDDIDPLLQACVHGLSEKQTRRLAAHDLEVQKREEEERRRREEEERERLLERRAVPTLEDMEHMQYLRTQAPQTLSSHASMHMRSDGSDWPTQSQAPSSLPPSDGQDMHQMEPDSNVRVDHWLDGDTEMMSQINTAVSGIGVSGMDFGLSATDMGDSLPQLGSGFIPDSASQRGSILDTQQYLRSNLPSQASKFSNSTHHMERPRAGLTPGMSGMPGISGMSGSTRNMLLPVAESGLLAVGSSAAVLPIDSQLSLSSAGALAKRVGGGRYRGRSMTMVDEEDREEDEGGRGTGEGGSFVRDAASERDRFGEDSGDGGKVSDGERDAFSDSRLYSQGTLSDIDNQDLGSIPDLPAEEVGPQPQPAVITTTINDKVIRSTDICVSERTLLNSLKLKPYGPIWNELTGELDPKTMDDLDSNLREGMETDLLYREFLKTIPKDYLEIENDPSLIPAIQEPVDLPSVLASSSLPHRPTRRVANQDLRCDTFRTAPWGDKSKKEQWKKSNLYTGPDPKELMAPKGSMLTPTQARQRQQYQTWLRWWSSTVSPDDYLQFVAQEESDYLHHVYHLYDSEGSESEPEEEKERRERLVRLHSKLKAKRAKCEESYHRKNHFEQGLWNVNTVLMGGLGGDPDATGSSSEEDVEDLLRQLEQDGKGQEAEESQQQRLQTVWSRLQLSSQQSMEMAIKYSSHQNHHHIRKAITLWENACNVIEERENLLAQLQTFEESASDPSRLFAKGHRGSSGSRLQEAKTRSQLHTALDALDRKVSRVLRKLQQRFEDVVIYKGRPYHEKMKYDRTEMLYWLQQERRKIALTPAAKQRTSEVVVPTLNL